MDSLNTSEENQSDTEQPDLPKSPSGRTPKWVIEEMENKPDASGSPASESVSPLVGETDKAVRIYPSDIIPDRDIPESSNRKLFIITTAVIVGWIVLLAVPFIIVSR